MSTGYLFSKNESTQAAALTEEDKRAIALCVYGIEQGDFSNLSGYEDINFRISNIKLKRCNRIISDIVIKVSNPIEAKKIEHIVLQNQVLEKLRAAGGIETPEIITTKNGDKFDLFQINNHKYPVRAFKTLTGCVLEKFPPSNILMHQIGYEMATMHNIFDQENYTTEHIPFISSDNFVCLRREASILQNSNLLNESQLNLAKRVLNDYEERIYLKKSQLDIGLIHSDWNETNILVKNNDGCLEISGILDFGNAHVSARSCDIGSCILYLFLTYHQTITIHDVAKHFLQGYCSKRLYHEQYLILYCVRVRLVCSLLYGLRTFRLSIRKDNPDYILKTQKNGWTVLQNLMEIEKLLI